MEKKMMSDNCDRALAMAEFFNGSCAPGANDSRYNPHHAGAASLCRLCVGDDMGRSRCAPIAQERYFGHLGVLRCLQEGHGDVAFTKHSTIFQYADGKSQVPWARDLRSSNFRLLCTDGRIVPVSDFKSCHLAQIPGRMVGGTLCRLHLWMPCEENTTLFITMGKKIDQGDRVNIARMLTNAAKMFGQNSTLFRMFGTYHGSADVLFKDNTNGFKLVSIKGDYKEVFTSRFLHIMERSDPHKCINSATDSMPSFLALLASLIISYLLFN
ncbi:MFI2 [Cordylochernes scorpioides]|uniref:MFI2 n=1 Tax=Cordylochernes scorpioides TaxID=51811 RepID=A0ABY6KT56_9ARAC|nr:MFI2 [Cordylochernes scorpioides]